MADDDVEVTLTLQNLGEAKVENLVLKEFLKAENEFKEISLAPESKGVWKIDELNQGEIWKVTYVTDQKTNLNSLPELFGVPRESILKTIILNNLVKSSFFISASKVIEYVGLTIVVVAGLIILLVQVRDMQKKKKKKKSDKAAEGNAKEIAKETSTMIEGVKEKINIMPEVESKKNADVSKTSIPSDRGLRTDESDAKTESKNPEKAFIDAKQGGKEKGIRYSDVEHNVESRHKGQYSDLDQNEEKLDKLKDNF